MRRIACLLPLLISACVAGPGGADPSPAPTPPPVAAPAPPSFQPIPAGAEPMPTLGNSELPQGERTLSPYFIAGDTPAGSLPLESTTAEVRIAGAIADVTVTQTYRNQGQKPIEAIYVFPASTRAAVHGLTMTI